MSTNLRKRLTSSWSLIPAKLFSYSNDPPSPWAEVQFFLVHSSFSLNHIKAWRSSSDMFLSTSSLDSSGSLRIKSTALRNTSCPIPNWPVVVPSGNKAPPTPDSAIEGTRVLPARRWSNLAAHTSIVARSLNPIRLPEKLMALGADAPIPMSASGFFTTLNRSSKARTPFWPLNPYFFLLSFNGNNSSGKSLACLSSSMRLMYSGSSLMAFFVLPSDN